MNIRQSIAVLYAVAALGVAAVQLAPGIARAVVPVGPGVPQPIPASLGLAGPDLDATGHAEIDDLPAYLTDLGGERL